MFADFHTFVVFSIETDFGIRSASATTPAKRAGGSTSRGAAAASSRQTKLSFSQPSNSVHVIDDEDDDDAFSNFAGGSGTGRNGGRAGGVGDKR